MEWHLAHIIDLTNLFDARFQVRYLDVSGQRIKQKSVFRFSEKEAEEAAVKFDSVLLVNRFKNYLNQLNAINKYGNSNYRQKYLLDMHDLEGVLKNLVKYLDLYLTEPDMMGMIATLTVNRIDGFKLGVSKHVADYITKNTQRIYDLLVAFADRYNPEYNGCQDVELINRLHKKIENV